MKFLKIIVATGLAIFMLVLGEAVLENRNLPSEIEIEQARIMTTSVKQLASLKSQVVLYEAARGVVTINAYGFIDAPTQDKLVDELKSTLIRHPFSGKIDVNFFSEREFVTKENPDKSNISELKKPTFLRQIKLN